MNYCLLIVSFIEIIYIIYILNYFKTRIEFHHPFECVFTGLNEYLKHPMETGIYESKICKLGNCLSYIFALYIIIRYVVYETKWLEWSNSLSINLSTLNTVNSIVVLIAAFLSLLMNLNAFIYLIPVLLLEYFYVRKLFLTK